MQKKNFLTVHLHLMEWGVDGRVNNEFSLELIAHSSLTFFFLDVNFFIKFTYSEIGELVKIIFVMD